MSVNGHTEFFKKGISTGLKSGSVAEGRVKFGNLLFGECERENYEGICPALISLSSGMGSSKLRSTFYCR